MYQVPVRVWNEIAASQPISPMWLPMFRADPEQLTELLTSQADALEAKGLDASTIRAFQLVGPLWSENEAISDYMEEHRRADLRGALPEICSVEEAVLLASMELRLNPSQEVLLAWQLQETFGSLTDH
jgi:hypothetical protein